MRCGRGNSRAAPDLSRSNFSRAARPHLSNSSMRCYCSGLVRAGTALKAWSCLRYRIIFARTRCSPMKGAWCACMWDWKIRLTFAGISNRRLPAYEPATSHRRRRLGAQGNVTERHAAGRAMFELAKRTLIWGQTLTLLLTLPALVLSSRSGRLDAIRCLIFWLRSGEHCMPILR